jgi:hypothetical protein
MSPPETQEQVQARFDAATEARVSPCMWIPPKWEEVKANSFKLTDNSSNEHLFDDEQVKSEWFAHVDERKQMQPPGPPESPFDPDHWPNPFGDFSHGDEYSEIAPGLGADPEDIVKLLQRRDVRQHLPQGITVNDKAYNEAVEVLRGNGHGETSGAVAVAEALKTKGVKAFIIEQLKVSQQVFAETISLLNEATPYPNRLTFLNKLKAIVGPQSTGMQRLAQVFDWALCRTTDLMDALNKAVAEGLGGEDDYKAARTKYLNFLRDLDDHEPEKSSEHIDVTDEDFRSGYGRALKWICIDPVIAAGRIVGVRVVVKWNPHSSSSGIPISHKP